MSEERDNLKKEGLEIEVKLKTMVELGKPLITNSLLVKEGEKLGLEEIQLTREFLQVIAPVDKDTLWAHAHSQLAGRFAREIALALELDPNKLEITALLHDAGRFITHRYLRSDLLGDLLLRKLDMREDITQSMTSIRHYVRGQRTYKDIKSLTPAQRVVEAADWCGKRIAEKWGIRVFQEVLNYHRSTRSRYEKVTGQEAVWPGERFALNHMLPNETIEDEGVLDRAARIIEEIIGWLKEEGVDVEEIRQKILEEERNSPIQAVIFDLGGVLIPDTDQVVKRDFTQAFGISGETMEKTWGELVPQLQTGTVSEDAFWQQFSEKVEKTLPDGYQNLWTKSFDTKTNPEVIKIIEELKGRGYRVIGLTDIVPAHQRALKEAGVFDHFSIVVSSRETKMTKTSTGTTYANATSQLKKTEASPEAFYIAAVRLNLPPQACLVIDDKKSAVETAGVAQMKAIQFQSVRNLREALQEKNLI